MFWRKKKQDEAYGLDVYGAAIRRQSALAKYEAALDAIAAQETASANATVKRMAKIARDALEGV